MTKQEELDFVEKTGDFREKLYTIGQDGERRWVYNSIARGFFFRWRAIVAYLLMLVYLVVPWLKVGGLQAVWLDIPSRRFVFFGYTFWATDTFLLVLTFGFLGVCLFFFTALLGRVWCGWACPETVFLEFLFRPIERLIEGGPAQRQRLDEGSWGGEKILKKLIKYSIFLFLSWLIATCGLAYFVGAQPLIDMITGWPQDHPAPFIFTLIVTVFSVFQFGWFREQFCTVLCPYARFQSVLLDANSIVVGYDAKRGEPRTKAAKGGGKEDGAGDCIDCGMCVRVCPTGIDIRNGLQLECVSCTQCIDACDSVMARIGRPLGLIRYDTENGLARKPGRILRPRIVFYSTILVVYIIGASYWLTHRELSEAQILRSPGEMPYSMLDSLTVSNHLNVRISNKSSRETRYSIKGLNAGGITLVIPLNPVTVGAGKIATAPVFANFPKSALKNGRADLELEVSTPGGYSRKLSVVLLGPDEK